MTRNESIAVKMKLEKKFRFNMFQIKKITICVLFSAAAVELQGELVPHSKPVYWSSPQC